MVSIVKAHIQRFRSIMEMTVDFDIESNLLSICGQNNVGKTNTLRAIGLFFDPKTYAPKLDIPTLKNATWGGSVHPKIELVFYDNKSNEKFVLVRDFKDYNTDENNITGYKYSGGSEKRKLNKKELTSSEIRAFLSKIKFIYVESVNLVIPELIDFITKDMLNLQYNKTRFTNSKVALKEAYETYVDGLKEILDIFAKDISGTFQEFRENWNIEFRVPKKSDSFRSLISDDVSLDIKDRGSFGITSKGSGLQRLAHILLQFEIAEKLAVNNNVIICIDEIESYLHEGLQKKLNEFLAEKSKKIQILYTTHSKVFIDTYKMKNTVLLSSKWSAQYVTRKDREIDVMETYAIDVNTDDGYKLICEHLGIENERYEMLQKNNILVEGASDKKYIEELCRYFNIPAINIIPVNGADNVQKYLDFYDSFYKDSSSYKPKIKIILDNDIKGREVYKKLLNKSYSNIETSLELLTNYRNNSSKNLEKNSTNNEIEDFLYPELFCFLVNEFLKKNGMNTIDPKITCEKCNKKSFGASGILSICEYEKNDANSDRGSEFTFASSSNDNNRVKEGLAKMFQIEGNKKMIELLGHCDKKYPQVKINLEDMMNI